MWVADLKGDAAFEEWLAKNGITLSEAARIQVPYVSSNDASGEVAALGLGAIVPAAATLGFTTWNAFGNSNGHSRVGAYAGLVSSLVTSGAGLAIRRQQDRARGIRYAANSLTGAGIIGAAVATRSLLHRPRYLAARNVDNAKRGAVQTSVSPIIPVTKDGGAGLSMSIRF